MHHDTKEYEGHAWVTPEEILTGTYHPALKRAVHDYLRLQKYHELMEWALHNEKSDQEIATKCREYFRNSNF